MSSRRRVLVGTASVSAALLAGCSSFAADPPPVDDQPCPPGEFVHSPVSCSHAAESETGVELHVSPSTITDESDIDDFTIEIRNESDAEMTLDAFRWRIWRKDHDDWKRFDERGGNDGSEDVVTVQPTNSVSWTGLKTVFDAFDRKSPSGLYAAVLPVDIDGTVVRCVCVFRITTQ